MSYKERTRMIIDRHGLTQRNGVVLGFRFEMALLYAFRLHADQRKKGKDVPYFSHLLGVASLVIEAGGDEDQAIAALLHDALEDVEQDAPVTRDALRSLFGERVEQIVENCSDTLPGSAERGPETSRERKAHYLQHLKTADDDTLRV